MPSLKPGDLAPPIEARTHDDQAFSLAALRGRFVVIYFYPRAFTPVCTIETRLFRDRSEELASLGASVVGVSTDEADAQCEFANKQGVQFPLLADHDERITRAYGVKWPLLGRAMRVTFVIDREGRIAERIHHELSADRHVEGAIKAVERMRAKAAE